MTTTSAEALTALILSARGVRPQSLANAEAEEVLNIALALLIELSVSNDRIDRLERMVAALRDAGLDIGENPTSKKDLEKIQIQINQWVADTGLPRRHISRILAMSIGENHSPQALREYTGEEE